MIQTVAFHQMISSGPVTMAVEQSADNPTIQNAGERFVFLLRFPFRHDFVAADKAANMKTVRIRGAAAETGVGRRVKFLQRLGLAVTHDHFAPFAATDPG